MAAAEAGGKPQPVLCRLMFPGASEDAVKEVLGGGELPSLELAIDLQPSTAPVTLQLLWNDKPVPLQVLTILALMPYCTEGCHILQGMDQQATTSRCCGYLKIVSRILQSFF